MDPSIIQFVGMLRTRLVEAQARLAEKQARLQRAQAEHQATAQEVQSLQTLISLETARDQQRSAVQGLTRAIDSARSTPPTTTTTTTEMVSATMVHDKQVQEENKTDVVREVLRKHTNGITPGEVWRLSNGVDRPYVYSILKRMKDRGEVAERSGKYYLQVRDQAPVPPT